MVQLLEELPPELLAHVAGSLDDAAAAGRRSQASRASRLLLLPRLDQLLEARRSSRQQDKLYRMRRGSAAALSVYDLSNGDAAIGLHAGSLDSYIFRCYPGDSVLRIGVGAQNVQRRCSGTLLLRGIGPATTSKFTAWPLMRPHGAHLWMQRPHERRNRTAGVQQT